MFNLSIHDSSFKPTMTGKKSTITGINKLLSLLADGLISIIIPALNEQGGIERTIKGISLSAIKDTTGYSVEFIVVDGQSTDSTRDIATKLGARVVIEGRKGYGRACKSGFAAAKGDILVTIDADSTYPTECIPEYVKLLQENELDFITVNRFPCMDKGAMSPTRRVGNMILTSALKLLYSLDIKDSQSGMWIMRRRFISQIKIFSDNMSMSEEIKIIAFKFFKSKEIEGRYSARSGKTKLRLVQDGFMNLKYLFDFRKKLQSSLIKSVTVTKENEVPFKGLDKHR
jgi:glycosyltransferase involved in cell wall biosynthesis